MSCMSLYLSSLQDRGVLSVARDGRQVTSGYKGTPLLRPDNNNRANRVAGDCVTSCESLVPSSVFISSLSCSPFVCNSSVHVCFVFFIPVFIFCFFSPAFSVLLPTSRSWIQKVLGLKRTNRAVPFCTPRLIYPSGTQPKLLTALPMRCGENHCLDSKCERPR
jgi:hypothetical protein